jgi:hypothetical protein
MTKFAKFLAAILCLGGAFGTVLGAYLIFKSLDDTWINLLIAVFFLCMFSWATFVGVHLWKNTPFGRNWAPIVFLTQVPIVYSPSMIYVWFTGAQLAPLLKIHSGRTELTFIMNGGAGGQFYLNGGTSELIFGLNVLAIFGVIYLVRSNYVSKRALLPNRDPESAP